MRLLLLPGAVELRNEVSRAFGLELPGTLVYDYPTSSAIAAFLSARVDPAATTVLQMAGQVRLLPAHARCTLASTSPAHRTAQRLARAVWRRAATAAQACAQQAAIPTITLLAGITARIAGGESTSSGHTVSVARDAVERVPLDRWDSDCRDGADGDARALSGRFGGFVSGWADFDSRAFGIARAEAAVMDPQQRALLEVGALHDRAAGIQTHVEHACRLSAVGLSSRCITGRMEAGGSRHRCQLDSGGRGDRAAGRGSCDCIPHGRPRLPGHRPRPQRCGWPLVVHLRSQGSPAHVTCAWQLTASRQGAMQRIAVHFE